MVCCSRKVQTIRKPALQFATIRRLGLIGFTPAAKANKAERSCSKDGTQYFGNAKFLHLTGDAIARSLANLIAGGEPSIHKEAETLPKTK